MLKPQDIQVTVLDLTTANEAVNKELDLRKKYRIETYTGMIEFNGRVVLLTGEAIFQPDNNGFSVSLFEVPDNPNAFAMSPSYHVKLKKSEFGSAGTKSLVEFMGSRFNYNSRIKSNIRGLLEYLETGK